MCTRIFNFKFDNDLEKCLIPIIQTERQPLTYEKYGLLTLNFETFTQVICVCWTVDINS